MYGERQHIRSRDSTRIKTGKPKSTKSDGRKVIVEQNHSTSSDQISFCRRNTRLLIYLLCLIGFIFQCIPRVQEYIYSPTTTSIRFSRNFTISPPCVTMCPSDIHLRHPSLWEPLLRSQGISASYKTTYELLNITKMNIETIWNISRIITTSLGYTVGHKGVAADPEMMLMQENSPSYEMHEITTVLGICRAFCPKHDLPYLGTLTGLHITARGDIPKYSNFSMPPHYKVMFHAESYLPIVRFVAGYQSQNLPFASHVNYMVNLREKRNLNTWQNPCGSQREYHECSASCFEDKIVKTSNVTCRLPYMVRRIDLPLCTTADHFEKVYNATLAVIYSHSLCHHCRRPCKAISYETQQILPNKLMFLFSLFLCYTSNKVEIIEEIVNYSLSSLFSDVGGSLGLFTGACIFSVFDVMEKFFVNAMCTQRNAVKSNKVCAQMDRTSLE